MKLRRASVLLFLAAVVAAVHAQDTKPPSKELPKAPDGWNYVAAKDGSYQFLFPTETKSSASRERTFKRASLSGKVQGNYCTLKDDTRLLLEATNLAGAAVKDLKIGDVYNLMIDAAKENGTEATEPKEIQIGGLKGKELFVTKDTLVKREVFLVVKGRVYELSVVANDKEKTTNATADTFLKSLVLMPKAPPKTEPGKDQPKPEAKPPAEKP